MKPTTIRSGKTILFIASLILTAGLVSWDRNDAGRQYRQAFTDTTPKTKLNRDKKVRDLDDVLDELNNADLKVNYEKIKQQMEESMKQLDASQMKIKLDEAIKSIDMEKIKKELDASMAKIDMEKIKTEMAEAMKGFDAARIQKEVQESMEKVDWQKMKENLEKVKEIDMKKLEVEMEKAKEELRNISPRIEKEMEKAKVDIEKAKEKIKEYKSFVDGLQADGLINKKDGYTLKHKDGELFINGKKASEATYNKYRSFLEKHKTFNIEKSDDDFDINMD